jgi:hypothetical protein
LDKELVNYMEGLAKEAGSRDPEKVWQLVKHPQLTHDLIARYPQPKAEAKNNEFTQMEHIYYSTKMYFDDALSVTSPDTLENESEFNLDEMLEFMEFDEDASDETGEGNVYEESNAVKFDRYETFLTNGNEDYSKIFKLGDAYYIIADGLNKTELVTLRAELAQQHSVDGMYRVLVKFGDQTIDTKLLTDKLDTSKIIELLGGKVCAS